MIPPNKMTMKGMMADTTAIVLTIEVSGHKPEKMNVNIVIGITRVINEKKPITLK